MRKVTFVLLVLLVLSASAGAALAKDEGAGHDPWTYLEQNSTTDVPDGSADGAGRNRAYYGPGANGPGYGSSFWSYADTKDSARKFEGSYKAFVAENGLNANGTPRTDSIGTYTDGTAKGPHGGLDGVLYATTSNQCKTCHAVHRAGGAFKLMRADSADDACSYCHVDDHRHAQRVAYNNSNDGIYAKNGHTMGSGRAIPDSSVRQWLEPMTLSALADDTDTTMNWTIRVRRYSEERQKLFVYTSDRASRHTGTNNGLLRYGPTLLTCMSCHQPHNATNLVWKPGTDTTGYKLLRLSPSGSMMTNSTTPTDQPNVFNGTVTGNKYKVSVPQVLQGPGNTGHNLGKSATEPDAQTSGGVFTTWTQWKGTGATSTTETSGDNGAGMLSMWCADCHNLNIASNGDRPTSNTTDTAAAFRGGGGPSSGYGGGRYHADRSHTAGSYYTPCYSCHRTNGDGGRISGNTALWEPTATAGSLTGVTCNRCHYRYTQYQIDNASNDFPHSGADQSTKLLSDWYNASGGEALDQVCKYCHNLVGSDM